jgi:hypothetical protein
MLTLPPALEPVPIADVADVLSEAVRRLSGAPAEQGRDLAASLEHAGFVVVRRPSLRPQLTP